MPQICWECCVEGFPTEGVAFSAAHIQADPDSNMMKFVRSVLACRRIINDNVQIEADWQRSISKRTSVNRCATRR